MKKKLLKLFPWICGFIVIIAVLNTEVTTKQGINYKIRTIRIPLYLKILDFLDRHYNYAQLVRSITSGAKTDEERVMRIFKWTHENIKMAREGMPIIDDHVWHIIVRGYGATEQSSDVFTTLCNYAGMESFYSWIFNRANTQEIVLSFVKTKSGWVLLDQYRGVYFKNKEGHLAGIEEIKTGKSVIEGLPGITTLDFDYREYFKNLPDIKEIGSSRGKIQSPINRLKYEIRKRMR